MGHIDKSEEKVQEIRRIITHWGFGTGQPDDVAVIINEKSALKKESKPIDFNERLLVVRGGKKVRKVGESYFCDWNFGPRI